MEILEIGELDTWVAFVVDELRARGVEVRVLARQRHRPGTLPGNVKVAIG